MSVITDIESLVSILNAVIKLVESVDPNAVNNPLVMKAQGILNELNSI